jgi:hypothetical protein
VISKVNGETTRLNTFRLTNRVNTFVVLASMGIRRREIESN